MADIALLWNHRSKYARVFLLCAVTTNDSFKTLAPGVKPLTVGLKTRPLPQAFVLHMGKRNAACLTEPLHYPLI